MITILELVKSRAFFICNTLAGNGRIILSTMCALGEFKLAEDVLTTKYLVSMIRFQIHDVPSLIPNAHIVENRAVEPLLFKAWLILFTQLSTRLRHIVQTCLSFNSAQYNSHQSGAKVNANCVFSKPRTRHTRAQTM